MGVVTAKLWGRIPAPPLTGCAPSGDLHRPCLPGSPTPAGGGCGAAVRTPRAAPDSPAWNQHVLGPPALSLCVEEADQLLPCDSGANSDWLSRWPS